MRRPDAFDRKLLAYRKEHGMTVPAATSKSCEVRECPACTGDAWDKLKDQPAPCSCPCHLRSTTRRSR